IRDSVGATLRVTRVAVRDPAKHRECDLTGIRVATDPLAVANAEDVDLLIALIGGESMLEPVRAALQRGISVVTANKHLLAVHGGELERLAADSKSTIRSEASAGGGIPVLQALEHGLRTEHFQFLVAILNGTTNYILSTMERDGRDFAEALQAAQSLGFAESDPTLDLSGADTAQELAILVRRAVRGAGALPTAQAVLGDVIVAAREFVAGVRFLGAAEKHEPERRLPLDAVRTKYYLRLIVEDRPGVLAQVAACLGGTNVSVAQMFQA